MNYKMTFLQGCR